jgi:hypothetical protein
LDGIVLMRGEEWFHARFSIRGCFGGVCGCLLWRNKDFRIPVFHKSRELAMAPTPINFFSDKLSTKILQATLDVLYSTKATIHRPCIQTVL